MGSGALILLCILAGFALVLALLFFPAQYNVYKMKREARRKQEEQKEQAEYLIAISGARSPLIEQIELKKRAALNAVKDQLQQIRQRAGQNPVTDQIVQRARPTEAVVDSASAHKLMQELDAALIAKHRALIDKFLEIAERKVAVIDDYGDENWEALDKEIERCMLKIAKIEGDEDKAIRMVKGERCFVALGVPMLIPGGFGKYGWLKYGNLTTNLEKEFRAYGQSA